MAEEQKSEKKLIIDEDWKKQAQQEKETLASKEEQEQGKATETDQGQRRSGPLPEGDLMGLVNMLATQSLFAMGVLRVEGQDDREPDLEMARYNIDMLEALETKTKGNLTDQETQMLKSTLSELRMGYVQIANHGVPKPE